MKFFEGSPTSFLISSLSEYFLLILPYEKNFTRLTGHSYRAEGKCLLRLRALILLTLCAQENRKPPHQSTSKKRNVKPSRTTRIFQMHFSCVLAALAFVADTNFFCSVN